MAYQLIRDSEKKKLVRLADIPEPRHQNAIRNHLIELEQRVAELESEVKQNRRDYDNHLVYGAGAGIATTVLFAALVGWLAWLGGWL